MGVRWQVGMAENRMLAALSKQATLAQEQLQHLQVYPYLPIYLHYLPTYLPTYAALVAILAYVTLSPLLLTSLSSLLHRG